MFHASNTKLLDDSYEDLLFDIGHDALTQRYPRFQEAHTVWVSLRREEQLDALKRWLGSESNSGSIIIFDDLDGLGDAKTIQRALPPINSTFIYSCRNPSMHRSPLLRAVPVAIPPLTIEEAVALLSREMFSHSIIASSTESQSLASLSCGHPLTILVYVHFMAHVLRYEQASPSQRTLTAAFIELSGGQGRRARANLLRTQIHGCPSLMESFERSIQRLETLVVSTAVRLIEIIAFISAPPGCQTEAHYSVYFRARPWLEEADDDMPDYDLLGSLEGKGIIFVALEKVSLLLNNASSETQFPPIWLECARHRCEAKTRIRYLRQLLYVCFLDSTSDGVETTAELFLNNIVTNAESFGISRMELCGGLDIGCWLIERSPV